MADISFSERAWEEFQYWMGQDKKTVKRITALLKDISRSPFEGIGKPEPLVGEKREMEQTHKRSRPFGIFRG